MKTLNPCASSFLLGMAIAYIIQSLSLAAVAIVKGRNCNCCSELPCDC